MSNSRRRHHLNNKGMKSEGMLYDENNTLAALFSYYFQYLVSFTFVYLKNLYGH